MDVKKVLKDAEEAITTYEWLAVTEFDATTVIDSEDARKVLYEALTAQLDAAIETIENDPVYQSPPQDSFDGGFRQGVVHALFLLKEARLFLSEDGGCEELQS